MPGSVIWLLVRTAEARDNLRSTAGALGVDPQRLIFASPLPKENHMARLKLADLALDTYTVNGHTTTSDALMAGVPVITCQGTHFASRAAGSILQAIGLGDLVTASPAAYEQLAVALATHPSERLAIVKRLGQNKKSHPLFDIDRYVRNLETAYLQIWKHRSMGMTSGINTEVFHRKDSL